VDRAEQRGNQGLENQDALSASDPERSSSTWVAVSAEPAHLLPTASMTPAASAPSAIAAGGQHPSRRSGRSRPVRGAGAVYPSGFGADSYVLSRRRSRALDRVLEALGFEKRRELPIRDEAVNYFLGVAGQDGPELTYNFGVDSSELGIGYGHIAVTVDDIEQTRARLAEKGIEPEKPPFRVREGGSLIAFVRDPDDYRVELIERGRACA
jgi:lactoylglutathione lyase